MHVQLQKSLIFAQNCLLQVLAIQYFTQLLHHIDQVLQLRLFDVKLVIDVLYQVLFHLLNLVLVRLIVLVKHRDSVHKGIIGFHPQLVDRRVLRRDYLTESGNRRLFQTGEVILCDDYVCDLLESDAEQVKIPENRFF